MSVQAIRDFINRHNASAAGLGALGAALDAKASGAPLDATLAARIDDLLVALGADQPLAELTAPQAALFLAEIRHTLAMDAKLPYAHTRGTSWSFSDPQLLQSIGDFARGHADGLTRNVIPALEGLGACVGSRGGAFLDIGVGVAGTAIAMAELWPELRVVGIDPWQPSLALARENVARAGLAERIELREQRAEDLEDDQAFDLAWMPTAFIPERVIPAALQRTLRALRPGGWLVFVCWVDFQSLPAQTAALWRLRATTWGGPTWTTGDGEQMIRKSGYADVRTLPSPPGSPIGLVVGRRSPAPLATA